MRRKCNSTQVILLILVAVFTILNPNFLSPFNLYNFLMQNEYRIVMITGLAIIMLGGEIDLSLGYQISLVGILIGKLLTADVPVPICILIGLAAGCCCGLLNGFLIAGLNLSSVIVTLITQKLFQGISYLLSKGMTYSDFPEPIMSISGMKGSTMPAGHIIMILSILFLEGMFCFTILGKNIFKHPAHPYTNGLFGALPNMNLNSSRLRPIEGLLPDPTNLPAGCAFAPRCPHATDKCRQGTIPAVELEPGHFCECIRLDEIRKER